MKHKYMRILNEAEIQSNMDYPSINDLRNIVNKVHLVWVPEALKDEMYRMRPLA